MWILEQNLKKKKIIIKNLKKQNKSQNENAMIPLNNLSKIWVFEKRLLGHRTESETKPA